jgi:cytochrome c
MNSFEMNKILGAVLATCMGVVALNIASGAIFSAPKPAKPGYEIAVPEKASLGGSQQPAQQPPAVPLAQLIANADVERGNSSSQKCAACHTFDKGGKHGLGPNLWGIIGRAKGSAEGFAGYSPAMKAAGGQWTVQDLMDFVANPNEKVPGTFMAIFGGIARAQERADLMAYLNTLSDNPTPLRAAGPSGVQRADLSPR